MIWPFALQAQFTYVLDQDIPVSGSTNNLMSMPWAGGLNAAQYNTLDLNNDGKIDLVIFDRMANKVMTYLNINNNYIYAPQYEFLFPADVTNWILLRDFNCDGKKDIFTGDALGVKVYTNTTVPGENLSWKQFFFFVSAGAPKSSVLITKGFSGLINLQLQYDDLPSFIDADGDGDLDAFNMKYTGNSTMEYHRNFSKERYGTCDSLVFERVTQMWGNFTECGCGKFAFNGVECSSLPGGRTEHAGGKSILMLDVDNDNDLDLVFSEASCNNLYLLKNEGTTENPVINANSLFPADNPANFYIFPAAYYEDVDFDGIRDLISTPNIYTKADSRSTLATSNWFYKNLGTEQLPNFGFAKPNFLQDQMIDVGDNAVPAFADFDGDGDFDLFISENSATTFSSKIYFYENVGTPGSPAFKLVTDNYLGFSSSNFYNLKIQFVDITSDGKIDFVFSATSNQQTSLYYIANTSETTLDFSGQSISYIDISLAYEENIYVYDIGGEIDNKPDGKPDILLGKRAGSLEYWVNNGNVTFTQKNSQFLGLTTSVLRQNTTCAIGDLDGDENLDLILGGQTKGLTIVSDFQKAQDTAEGISDIIVSPLQDSIYTTHNLGGRTWPTVVNLYKTDKPAIVVGNILGGLVILKNNNGQFQPEHPVIEIYPNPAEQMATLNIKVDRDIYLQIFSALGQQLSEPMAISRNEKISYPLNALAKGIYLFQFKFNSKSYTRRIVVY